MSKLITLTLVFVTLNSSSFAQFKTLSNGKQIDKRLTGTWEGSEKDTQMEGMTKKWTMIRNDDGTFQLDFEITTDGETDKTTETGTWWIENAKFHEYHDYSGMTDVYEYEILNKKSVKFKSQSLAMEMNTDSYEFIDHKVKNKKKNKMSKQDGLSFETALKVNSVAEEYDFVRLNCQDCTFIRQALVEHKKKPYDILTLEKPNGDEINYYFDINSFYGNF